MTLELIYYSCPACGKPRTAPASITGSTRACQHCNEMTVVPPVSTRTIQPPASPVILSKKKSRRPKLKQFGSLKAKDFLTTSVWVAVHSVDSDENWYDDADEETFRAWKGDLPVSPEGGLFLVAAKFALADGREFQGFVTPQCAGEPFNLGIAQPQLFFPSGKFYGFWDGMIKRSDKERKRLYSELGKDPAAIFPIVFAAEPNLANGTVSGSIPGFCYLVNGKADVYF